MTSCFPNGVPVGEIFKRRPEERSIFVPCVCHGFMQGWWNQFQARFLNQGEWEHQKWQGDRVKRMVYAWRWYCKGVLNKSNTQHAVRSATISQKPAEYVPTQTACEADLWHATYIQACVFLLTSCVLISLLRSLTILACNLGPGTKLEGVQIIGIR